MKVNIICRDLNEDKILPRLAKALAEGTGWQLSENPRGDVDLNYWIIYIDYAERNSDFRGTKRMAYFSHYEPDSPFKAHWWNDAMGAMDGAILTAKRYETMLPTALPKFLARPPVDVDLFKPAARTRKNAKPRIGVSGYVDKRSPRKNAYMVKILAEKFGDRYEIVASGAGWSVPTKLYPYSELPIFYNSLDALICVSSIEGIPMPPLEAMACGVPVVIPHGVGLLDELPMMDGIARHTADNFETLVEAIERTLHTKHDPAALRDVIAECYTARNWRDDHRAAFEAVTNKKETARVTATKPAKRESDRHGKRGVYYVAYGTAARNCAQGAMASFRQHMPGVEIALASNQPLGEEDVFIKQPDEDIGGRSVKTKIYDVTPVDWQYVLYLDADTEIIAPIHFIYELLEDGFDFVICKNPGKYHTARQMIRSDNKDECDATFEKIGTDELIQLNGGVFAFQRNARTEAFFRMWHAEWLRWGKRDQAALLRALFAHPLKVMVLGNEWNTITRYDNAERSAGILHYPMTARRWRGMVHHRSDSDEAWKMVEQFERQGKRN